MGTSTDMICRHDEYAKKCSICLNIKIKQLEEEKSHWKSVYETLLMTHDEDVIKENKQLKEAIEEIDEQTTALISDLHDEDSQFIDTAKDIRQIAQKTLEK